MIVCWMKEIELKDMKWIWLNKNKRKIIIIKRNYQYLNQTHL